MIATLVAVVLLVAAVVAVLLIASDRRRSPRRESMSERHDRLDREAAARTRPTSSNRKAGRGSL